MKSKDYTIREVTDKVAKSTITEHILRSLPQWFGIEDALMEYVQGVGDSTFFACYDSDDAVGFISLIFHNDHTAEIYVMGILEPYHRQGIGRALVKASEEKLTEAGYKLFMVKTLGESHSDPSYKKTRKFYRSMGFFPLEEIPAIWGEANPCLIMVKPLSGS